MSRVAPCWSQPHQRGGVTPDKSVIGPEGEQEEVGDDPPTAGFMVLGASEQAGLLLTLQSLMLFTTWLYSLLKV